MRLLSTLLLCLAAARAQSRLTLRPEVITRCDPNGLGRARLTWSHDGPGPVQIRVGAPDGVPLTGPEFPSGEAETGDWVRDGMLFVLVGPTGQELARALARVACRFDPLDTYFPLEVGNEWIFRVNTRFATSQYSLWRVVRAEPADGRLWFVVRQASAEAPERATEVRYRVDEAGRIYQGSAGGGEALWFDPAAPPGEGGVLRVENRGVPLDLALGRFRDTVSYRRMEVLELERGVFVRGLGLAKSESTMLTGSSGGFLSGRELVWARLGERQRFATPAAGLELSVERTDLDVTGRRVTNCAVPCYFAACGFAPGADPPGTYKPCFQARLRTTAAAGDTLDFELLDAADRAVYSATQAATAEIEPAEVTLLRQIPLYAVPNQPFPPGPYRLRARVKSAGGAEKSSAAVALDLR